MEENKRELNLEEMEQVSGGSSLVDFFKKVIIWHVVHGNDKEHGGCNLDNVA